MYCLALLLLHFAPYTLYYRVLDNPYWRGRVRGTHSASDHKVTASHFTSQTLAKHDQVTSQIDEAQIVEHVALVADYEAAEGAEPGEVRSIFQRRW